jgi:hypothetical protein
MAMFSIAVVVPKQYVDELNKYYANGASLYFYDAKIDAIKDVGADYIIFRNTAATNSIVLIKSGARAENIYGEAHIFKDELNRNSTLGKGENSFIAGRPWNGGDNEDKKNYIWLSEETAATLNAAVGDIVLPEVGGQYVPYFEIEVVGIYKDYKDELNPTPAFVISYALAARVGNILEEGYNSWSGIIDIYDIMRISKVAQSLTDSETGYTDISNIIEDVNAINLSKGAFWIVTAFLLLLGGMVIYNLISMIINTREKSYGLYKLLGIGETQMIGVCFVGFLLIFLISLILGIIGAILFVSYFEGVANQLFNMIFDIRLIWYVPFVVFAVNLAVFYICYLKLKKRFKKISPLEIISEEL